MRVPDFIKNESKRQTILKGNGWESLENVSSIGMSLQINKKSQYETNRPNTLYVVINMGNFIGNFIWSNSTRCYDDVLSSGNIIKKISETILNQVYKSPF